jgi:hypothetical protein
VSRPGAAAGARSSRRDPSGEGAGRSLQTARDALRRILALNKFHHEVGELREAMRIDPCPFGDLRGDFVGIESGAEQRD